MTRTRQGYYSLLTNMKTIVQENDDECNDGDDGDGDDDDDQCNDDD